MDLEHFRNQAHAVWFEEYKAYAKAILKNGFGVGDCCAIILSPNEDNIAEIFQEGDMVVSEPNYKSNGTIQLPYGSIQIFIALVKHSHFTMDFPVTVNGYDFKKFPEYTFSLSALLSASFPRNLKTGIFKNTNGGLMVGLLEDITSGELGMHGTLSGLGVILMEECRKVISPFATDEDLVELTSEMFLSFMVSDVKNSS